MSQSCHHLKQEGGGTVVVDYEQLDDLTNSRPLAHAAGGGNDVLIANKLTYSTSSKASALHRPPPVYVQRAHVMRLVKSFDQLSFLNDRM